MGLQQLLLMLMMLEARQTTWADHQRAVLR
jgi:hypothetical protein